MDPTASPMEKNLGGLTWMNWKVLCSERSDAKFGRGGLFMGGFFAISGISLVIVGFGVSFGLLWYGAAVYYIWGLKRAASFAGAVNHLFLYAALTMVVGLVLYGIATLYESGETNVLPPRARWL